MVSSLVAAVEAAVVAEKQETEKLLIDAATAAESGVMVEIK